MFAVGYEIAFYQTESGMIPVDDFIKSLPDKSVAKILRDLELLKDFGSDLRYPFVVAIKGDRYDGLMELRTKQAGNIFRTFYFVVEHVGQGRQDTAVLLHAIQKKTDKTPRRDLETALERMRAHKARRQS